VVKIGPRAYHVALSGVSLWSEALGFGNIKVRPFFWGDGRSMVSGVDVVVAPLFLALISVFRHVEAPENYAFKGQQMV
jgi:hypothetical protein